MTYDPRPWFYALTLLLGAAAVAVAGVFHPMLTGDGPAQLTAIAGAPAWRAVHWSFAAGFVAVVAGLAGLGARSAGTPGDRAARVGALVSTFGYAMLLVGVLFMLGAATQLADTYTRGAPGLAGTHAVFLYDMLHPFAQAAVRIGAVGVSFGLYAMGWAALAGGALPRWLGLAGVAGGVIGVFGAAVAAPDTAWLVMGVALATLWQVGAAVVVLLGARRTADA